MAVLHAIKAILKSDEEFHDRFVNQLEIESKKRGMASADYYVLLEWANLVSEVRPVTTTIIGIQARCLYSCMFGKSRLARAAERSVVSALGYNLSSLGLYIDSATSATYACLLGLVCTVASTHAFEAVNSRRHDILKFYVTHVLGAKTVDAPVARALNPFFTDFAVDLKELSAPLERALLRAPETVIGDVTLELVRSVNQDWSEAVDQNLLSPLLQACKSSNSLVRENAGLTLASLFAKCTTRADAIATKVLHAATPDTRATYLTALASLPASSGLAKLVCDRVGALAAKETNEAAVAAEVACLFAHYDDIMESVVLSGLRHKLLNLRKYWVMAVGEKFYPDKGLPASYSAALLESYSTVIANPLTAVQTKLIVAGYVVAALLKVDKFDKLLDRVYTKLGTRQEQVWAIRALRANVSSSNNWAAAFAYFVDSADSKVQRLARDQLTAAYIEFPEQVFQAVSNQRTRSILHCITPRNSTVDINIVERQLTQLVVVPNWIELCQRVKVDPNNLVSKFIEEFKSVIFETQDTDASTRAAATLVFVNPVMAPFVRDLIESDLTVDTDVVEVPSIDNSKKDRKAREEHARLTQIRDEQYARVQRGAKLVMELCKISREACDVWVPTSVDSLIRASTNRTLDDSTTRAVVDAFIELSCVANARIGTVRRAIALAILRLRSVPLPDNLTEEALPDLVTRVLFRLRFLSEQLPLDAISLVYVLPLLIIVLQTRQEEQVELAIETLAFHTDLFVNKFIPRLQVLECVIAFIKSYRNKGKECLLGICQAISSNYSTDELQLLLSSTISEDNFVRAAVLEGLDVCRAAGSVYVNKQEFDLDISYSSELWIACHDEIEQNATTAETIWEGNELHIDDSTPAKLIMFLDRIDIKNATARAIAHALEELDNDSIFHSFLSEIMELYRIRAQPPPTVYDEFGMVVRTIHKDPFECRLGIATTLKTLAPIFRPAELLEFLQFLISTLDDENAQVRQEMQEAGVLILNLHAKDSVELLMPVLESTLQSGTDRVKEGAIILYATLARHLSDATMVPNIVERLIATLRAPSEHVQLAVSQSLPHLITRVDGQKIQKYVNKLLHQLYAGKHSDRRGAAYGIAGIVKGVGISALADYEIMRNLIASLDDKKDPKKRQGVQFAFEILSLTLGKYFEPYVIEILPLLLSSLGDASADVREATSEAAKEIMKHTTSYGIKQLIPLILENFNQTQWRSKKGSVEMLGTMAYLDPRQLSESLSLIIPEIVGALNDTHKEVRKAASTSLQRFGEVISNPEIQSLVPVLLRAISDPTRYVDEALDSLIKTAFVHYIDAPSLALIVYILHRGLRERSASTKRKACQIVGNMASLTDSKDLVPYLDSLVAELEISMVDPVPATRATASKALGSLVEKLGEERLPDLIPKLLSILRADDNEGDRLGAAQAFAEVVCGLGVRKLEQVMPAVLKNVESKNANTRESFMNLMIFLPAAFGNNFSPYLSKVIPPILAGLADEVEAIRDTSLRAGRLIVKNYATKAVDLLLPELERGLSDENYRIRLSSIELTGDLLLQIGGDSGLTSLEEVLGADRRDRILSALYVCRFDVTAVVRNAALEVWKPIVPNTPRTVKEILPVLAQVIVRRLCSAEDDQRENASATLSELVRRFGDSLLAQFLPTLDSGMYKGDEQGVCVALTELIEATPQHVLDAHEEALMAFVKSALVNADGGVREAAAHTFDMLHEVFGDRAINAILPDLLALLQSTQSEYALAALKEIMAMKASVIVPVLIPVLLENVTAFNARALGLLAEVAGDALLDEVQEIMDALLRSDEPDASAAVDAIVACTDVETVSEMFVAFARDESARIRAAAFAHMRTYFESARPQEYREYAHDWVACGVSALADDEQDVVRSAFACTCALVSKLAKEDLVELVVATSAQVCELPDVFTMPNGPSAVLPIFAQGLMYGTPDERKHAAIGISAVVARTPAEILRPYVTQMTGPLIRTVGERVPGSVKVEIVHALTALLEKIPSFVRPFLPQLQRTFTKASGEDDERLADAATRALDVLAKVPRR